jgi:hypothetical protein
MKRESAVQLEIVKYIRSIGGWVIKVMRANENGCPDLLACIDGQFIGCEVKAEEHERNPYGKTSAWQKKQLKGIGDAGGIAMCVASLDQFKYELETL